MKKYLLLFVFYGFYATAQVGIGTTVPNGALDVTSTNDGLLIPRVALTATNATAPLTAPTTSELVYNTATAGIVPNNVTPGYYYWNGTAWVRLLNTESNDWNLLGNIGTSSGTNFIGTTDNQALDFRTNNIIRFRIQNNNQVFAMANGTSGNPFYSWDADSDIGMYRIGGNTLGFATNGIERFRLSNTEATFNETSNNNFDFRIESDGFANMFFIDGSTNRIGINTNTPANVIDFRTTNENIWLTYWENNHATNGGLAQFYHTNDTNGNRVLMGVTNYSGSTNQSTAVMGLSINGTTTGSGGIGVYGAANNESGNAIEGNLTFAGGYSGWAGYFNADVYSGGTYFGSDSRLKRDIKPINNALSLINKLEPVSYYFNTEKYPKIGLDENRLSYGFIAQDLEKILPEMVKDKNLKINSTDIKDANLNMKSETEVFKVVNYTLLIPILTQAIQEQQTIINEQNKRIEKLEKAVEELINKNS